MPRDTSRLASWGVAILSLAPFVWAYAAASANVAAQQAQRGWACGMPALAMMVWGLLGSAPLSFVATVLGYRSYRRLPQPRAAGRKWELFWIGLPAGFLTVGAVLLGLIFLL